jgi:hypothetical protein
MMIQHAHIAVLEFSFKLIAVNITISVRNHATQREVLDLALLAAHFNNRNE